VIGRFADWFRRFANLDADVLTRIKAPKESMHSFWKRRAQRNPFAVQPLLIVTKGWSYCTCYREAADEEMRVHQEWIYRQVGKSFRILPAKVLYSNLTGRGARRADAARS
jgi:hypothetical protein